MKPLWNLQKLFCLLAHFQVESKFSSQFPSSASKGNYWPPSPVEKSGTGESRQCWPPVWSDSACWWEWTGYSDPFSISTYPFLPVSLTPLNALLELKINTYSWKPLGKMKIELPETVIIKVLESINRKYFFFFFFFLRLSGCLVCSPGDKSIISDRVLLEVRFYTRPSWGDICGNVDASETSCQCLTAAYGKQAQEESEPWLPHCRCLWDKCFHHGWFQATNDEMPTYLTVGLQGGTSQLKHICPVIFEGWSHFLSICYHMSDDVPFKVGTWSSLWSAVCSVP